MPAEAPLFLMYTSGTTGKPKGCQHGTGGFLAYVAGTSKYVQDIHPEDVYWCMADIGWITGHSYIVYGPLAICASSVIYEGIPNYPDAGRCWRIAQDLGVNIFHTAPTAIRALRKIGPDEPEKYDYEFKHMTTVGEPIEPEVWKWYYRSGGKRKSCYRRYLVANRNRRIFMQHHTGPQTDETRQRRTGYAWNTSYHLR
jgi:acetyl-CoA synthetase